MGFSVQKKINPIFLRNCCLMTLPSCVQHSELTASSWQPRASLLAAPKAELSDGRRADDTQSRGQRDTVTPHSDLSHS